MQVNDNVVFENDDVKVSRVKISAKFSKHHVQRGKRLIVYLSDDTSIHHKNHDKGYENSIDRKLGDVVFRDGSTHSVQNTGDNKSDVLIIELKK